MLFDGAEQIGIDVFRNEIFHFFKGFELPIFLAVHRRVAFASVHIGRLEPPVEKGVQCAVF